MSLGEFDLIRTLLRPLAAGFPGALDLEDDAALVTVAAGRELVVAKDAMVAGIHFLPDDPARARRRQAAARQSLRSGGDG